MTATVPDDMTAEKLRTIADWLDTYDLLAQAHIDLLEAIGTTHDLTAASAVAASKEVQADLRRWADDLDWADV